MTDIRPSKQASQPVRRQRKVAQSAPRGAKKSAAKAQQRRPKNARPRSIRAALRGVSLRGRVSLLVMVAVGATVAVGSIVSYTVIRDTIYNRLDQDLLQRASIVAETTLAEPQRIQSLDTSANLAMDGLKATLVDENGQQAYKPPSILVEINGQETRVDPSLPVNPADYGIAASRSGSFFDTVSTNDGLYRTVTVPVQLGGGLALVVGTSMASTEATLHTLGLVALLVGLAGIAIAGTAGLAVGRAALRPVQRLTVATEYIARTGDLRKIEVTGSDELARLTKSVNTMLSALARSQEHQRRLVADAGHELRTPLTSIRTNLDLLAQTMAEPDNPRRSAEDRAELMIDVRAQMEELSVLIADLVELSRDERAIHTVELVDFAEVVERAVERVQRRAPSLTYDVRLSSWYLEGEPMSLERAVTNLLDNAAKWSPPEGTVTVKLEDGALQVADQGPGIAAEDMEHIFERFYRSTEARTMPGSGLGLAIVRQVAENHGGRVAVARAPGGGALLGVWLPGLPELPSAPEAAVPRASAPQALTAPVETLEQNAADLALPPGALGDPAGSARTASRPDAP